jgi:hypothetical protein
MTMCLPILGVSVYVFLMKGDQQVAQQGICSLLGFAVLGLSTAGLLAGRRNSQAMKVKQHTCAKDSTTTAWQRSCTHQQNSNMTVMSNHLS